METHPRALRVLKLDASGRYAASVSRRLTARIVERLGDAGTPVEVVERDLASGLPHVDEAVIVAYNTMDDARTPEQRDWLRLSDELVTELKAADVVLIGTPIYNFTVPAALKAWIDLVCRARETFRYGETGPVGLLEGKRAIVAVTSGGTPVGSAIDYATPYLRHVLGFIGIRDVEFVAADRLNFEDEGKIAIALQQVDQLVAARAADAASAEAAEAATAGTA